MEKNFLSIISQISELFCKFCNVSIYCLALDDMDKDRFYAELSFC